ncbi:MAG TPA: 2-phospho-L-lactate transferase [Actinomycetota bacterium]|nr:2-phospho-L-lactate transferase [Actinomycetota bacterium]
MKVAALAGGIGAGKFLRGVVRVVEPSDLTVVVNTGDDIDVHGLHVSPDVDSVTYWLAGLMDRERGWGREDETFRVTSELRTIGAARAWFGVGDLDLATHLYRTPRLSAGAGLSEVTDELRRRFGVAARILPMTDDAVTTRVDAVDVNGSPLDLHFQEYWVLRAGADSVKGIRFEGAERARPAPGVIGAIGDADVVLICPSNPAVSVGPILAVPGIAEAVRARRDISVGVSPIVGGAPIRGMADRLLPAVGVEVSAVGVAEHYAAQGLLGGWVIDDVDAAASPRVERLGLRVAVTDTVMVDDPAAESVARVALELAVAR